MLHRQMPVITAMRFVSLFSLMASTVASTVAFVGSPVNGVQLLPNYPKDWI